jgi:ABC-type nickel/cobalt efflux system permease component RcnA
MGKRSKSSVDFQYLMGDTLIKTGVALVWLVIAIGIYTPFNLREAMAEGMVGYIGMIAGMLLLALGLWQWGRGIRREATIADR